MFKLSDNGISVIVDATVAVMLTSAANTAATTTAGNCDRQHTDA